MTTRWTCLLVALGAASCTLDRSGIVDLDDGGGVVDAGPFDSGGFDSGGFDAGPDGGGVISIVEAAAGEAFTCALRSDGQVRCWGLNTDGQLGDGTTTSRAASMPVSLSQAATHIAAGDTHACAIVDTGEVYCWGKNDQGQIGNGLVGADEPRPVPVEGLTGATAIAAGGRHTCAVHESIVSCWGDNAQEQTGMGPDTEYTRPMAVLGLIGAPTAVSLGDAHSCAIAGGNVMCWGLDSDGQLGDGAETTSGGAMPVTANSIAGVTAIGLGHAHSCAVVGGATIACWGNGGDGRLGNDVDTNDRTEPTPVAMITSGEAVDGGLAHTCALLDGGDVVCWGINGDMELGTGGGGTSTAPVTVPLEGPASFITVGAEHACAIVSGQLFCWGKDTNERLGSGASGTGDQPPVLVDDLI